MALNFLVEDGSIVAGANSYVAVAEANDILSLAPEGDDAWTALQDADKQKALVFATQWLDQRAIWRGQRVTDPKWPFSRIQTPVTPQPLGWPRRHAHDREGHYISETVVPVEVRRATALVANHLLTNNGEDELQAGIRRFRGDTFELEYQQGFYKSPCPPWLKFVLNGLGQMGNEIGFKKIVRV